MATHPPKAKVFLVDDHHIVRSGIGSLIAQTKHLSVAGEAEDAQDLEKKLAKAKPDVLVLDLVMPGRRGIDLVRDIHAALPALPIVVYSMHDEVPFGARSIRAGASGYVTKRQPPGDLLVAIDRVLGGELYMTHAVAQDIARSVSRPAQQPHGQLSEREMEILVALCEGEAPGELAERLGLSAKTISAHKTTLCAKLKLRTTAEMVRYAIANNLVSFPQVDV